MYTINPYQLQKAYELSRSSQWDHERGAALAAQNLYQRARNWSWMRRLWSKLTGQKYHLLDLKLILGTCSVRGRHYAGTRTVSLGQIRGSEGRCHDFDREFLPLCPASRRRWVAIALARLTGDPLPPVSLIQVADTYFVRDGHHRISVARAMGQQGIDAEIVVWEVAGPLPWARATLADRIFGYQVQQKSVRSV